MKKHFLMACLVLPGIGTFAQGAKWSENGNSVSSGSFLGTTNAVALEFRVNNVPYLNIAPGGQFTFNEMTGSANALFMLNSSGKASRLEFDGNINNVLRGDGHFGPLDNAAGWFFSGGGVIWTSHKVGIGGLSTPAEMLEVNGNILANGNVMAQQFVAGDVVNGGKQLRISSGLCLKGFNAADGTRSEVCGMGHDFYIQSTSGLNNHTILNYSNNGSVLIGTEVPDANKLLVNGNTKINGQLNVTGDAFYTGKSHFARITGMPGDTVIYFGDSSMVLDHVNHRIYAGTSTTGPGPSLFTLKGVGIGSMTATGTASASVAIGTNVKSTAANAIAMGNGFTNSTINTFMVGFNSTTPTFFIGPASGAGTIGKVGIGTTTPAGDFQLLKTANTNAYISSSGANASNIWVTNSLLAYNFGVTNTAALQITDGVNPVLTYKNGNMAIGSSTLEEAFQIQTSPAFKLSIGDALYPDLGFGTSYIGFNATRLSTGWKTDSDTHNDGGAVFYGNAVGDVYLATIPRSGPGTGQNGINDASIKNNTRIFINGELGDIGIGTTCTSGYKLAVNGRIICEEIKVRLSDGTGCWPDYVFAKNYNLMSLNELEVFIDKNNHLPGFKPAAVIENEGVNLAETVKLQQQKIEELTLYLLELNKKLEKLESEK